MTGYIGGLEEEIFLILLLFENCTIFKRLKHYKKTNSEKCLLPWSLVTGFLPHRHLLFTLEYVSRYFSMHM